MIGRNLARTGHASSRIFLPVRNGNWPGGDRQPLPDRTGPGWGRRRFCDRHGDRATAAVAIEDTQHFEQTRQAVIATRVRLTQQMTRLGFEVLPSQANFIFARHPRRDVGEPAKALRERSIIVRHFKLPRIEQFLRITIGSDEQCALLDAALRKILG
jgi:hypothetical protein